MEMYRRYLLESLEELVEKLSRKKIYQADSMEFLSKKSWLEAVLKGCGHDEDSQARWSAICAFYEERKDFIGGETVEAINYQQRINKVKELSGGPERFGAYYAILEDTLVVATAADCACVPERSRNLMKHLVNQVLPALRPCAKQLFSYVKHALKDRNGAALPPTAANFLQSLYDDFNQTKGGDVP